MRLFAWLVLFVSIAACASGPAAPPSTGKAFTEAFDASHDLDGWENRGGRWELVDEPLAPSQPHAIEVMEAAPEGGSLLLADRGTYGDVEVAFALRSITLPGGSGVVFRFADPSNHYIARIGGASGQHQILEVSRGETTVLAEGPGPVQATSTFASVVVRARGDQFTLLVDGAEQVEARDATLSVGHVGLWVSEGTRAQFDDVAVSPV